MLVSRPCSGGIRMILETKNLTYSYQDGDRKRVILDDVNVSFEPGRFYTITGESGSGKTTFLSLIGALDQPEKGAILFKGKDISLDYEDYLKNGVGFVFQSYNLINYMTAFENVRIALDIANKKRKDEEIYGILKIVGIDKEKANRLVSKLSGGEMQRVAIARAIAKNPPILLADEPTGNLDEENSSFITGIFATLAHKFNMCVIMVTHNPAIAKSSDISYKVYIYDKKLIKDETH